MKVNIKEARKHYEAKTGLSMTQEHLASIVMVDHKGSLKSKLDLLNRMQAGRIKHPRMEILDRIATTCGVDFNFLLNQIN